MASLKTYGITSLISFALFSSLIACSSPPPEASSLPSTTNPPAATVEANRSAASSVEITRDITYAMPVDSHAPALLLDVYKPGEGGDGTPVVVFLHGYNATKEQHQRESQTLAERGALVFTINWPTPNTDLAWKDDGKDFRMMGEAHGCAIRYARARAPDHGGDPAQIVVVAFSMGARIGITAALLGDDLPVLWEEFAARRGGPPSQINCVEGDASANVQAFVGISGRYNSVNYLQTADPELWEIVSPYAHIGHSPHQRIRLILGEQDRNVSAELQEDFNQLLKDAGYDSSLVLWDGPHLVPTELTADVAIEVARK